MIMNTGAPGCETPIAQTGGLSVCYRSSGLLGHAIFDLSLQIFFIAGLGRFVFETAREWTVGHESVGLMVMGTQPTRCSRTSCLSLDYTRPHNC